ncbi:unnamed protein product [Closterium sp. Naga37s-1]|nr:unnamed protein product [Closterium sp. Naga37s-1]
MSDTTRFDDERLALETARKEEPRGMERREKLQDSGECEGPVQGEEQTSVEGAEGMEDYGTLETFQLLLRADMVHYLDVRGGWDLKACECCFDRAVSSRAQCALDMADLNSFRLEMKNPLPDSVPADPRPHSSRCDLEWEMRYPVRESERLQGMAALEQLKRKAASAPFQCAEAMILEWMAEPRVGVLMDLGRIRSYLPVILCTGHCHVPVPAPAGSTPLSLGPVKPAVSCAVSSFCGRCRSCWAAYRRAVSFAAILALVARCPRIVTLWKVQKDLYDTAFPGIAVALDAIRQEQPDCLASLLVQVLGVKESADLKEGFGFFVQHVLSGGLEKAHAKRKEGAGGETAEKTQGEEREKGRAGDGGKGSGGEKKGSKKWPNRIVGDGGRDKKDEKWKEHLKGRVWERYVDGMAWILEHGGGARRQFGCSHCGLGCSSSVGSGSIHGNGGRGNMEGRDIPKGMYVSGTGATDFAFGVAGVLSKPENCSDACVYILDGNNASKAQVEDAAIEEARASTASSAVSTAVRVPVNSNPVLAAFTYRVSCILQWVRIYGSDSISEMQCFKDSPQEHNLPIRHPFRELPSLLVRFGAIPKPLVGARHFCEWDEWPQSNEDAMKFPDDLNARCFGMGIVEESEESDAAAKTDARGDGEERGEGGEKTSVKAARRGGGGKRKGERGRSGRAASHKGGGRGGRSNWGGTQRSHTNAPTAARQMLTSKKELPIVRCRADIDFIVDVASRLFPPPACAECATCFSKYKSAIPFVAVIANFAYRPASVLFDCFVHVFPPPSLELAQLADTLCLNNPFSSYVSLRLSLPALRDHAERLPMLLLLVIALKWPTQMVQERQGAEERRAEQRETKGARAGCGTGEEEDGEEEGADEEDVWKAWEEVLSWCDTAVLAWPASVRDGRKWYDAGSIAAAVSLDCKGSTEPPREVDTRQLVTEMFRAAAQTRFCADVNGQDGSGRSSGAGSGSDSGSSNSNRGGSASSSGGKDIGDSSSERKGKKAEMPAYLEPWPGGTNLVACLREMLLGDPCYLPAPPAAPATYSGVNANAAVPNHASARVSFSKGPGTSAYEGHLCGAEGCERVGGGGVKLRSCGGCGKVAYCSRECQKAHWPSHKLTCPGRSNGKKSGTSSGKVSGKMREQGQQVIRGRSNSMM